MRTYQDFMEVAEKSDRERMEFVLAAINDHKGSELYQQAVASAPESPFLSRSGGCIA